jgi:DNA-binding MarR family transcriptional regulator
MPSTADPIDRKAVLARFASNLPRHLSVVAGTLNQRLVGDCSEQGYPGVRAAFIQLLFQLRPGGRRLVDIAQHCGLTQQAAGQIADELEHLGYVKRHPDPDDARAKRLLITPKGQKLLICAERASSQIEQELSQRIGAAALIDFQANCARLFHALVVAQEPQPDHDPAVTLPLCLAGLATYCERTLMELDRARGYKDLKMSYAQVLTYTSPHGTLINDLARINNVSKQAISQVVKQVEEAGYVQRRRHPGDKRSTMIFLTDAGLRLIRDSLDNVARIEADLARVLGSRDAARFASTVGELATQLDHGLRLDGSSTELSMEALLHRAMEKLYLESNSAERARLFNHAGSKAKLSAAVLKILASLQIRVPD